MASPFAYKPTQEDLEQRKKRGPQLLDIKDLRRFVKKILTVKHKTDIGFTWHAQYGDFMVMNKLEAQEQMLIWKDLAKRGKISILEGNNREYDVDGQTIYTMVVQPTQEDHCPMMCPLSLALDTMVSGFTYAYTKKENRDAIYRYVAKYIK